MMATDIIKEKEKCLIHKMGFCCILKEGSYVTAPCTWTSIQFLGLFSTNFKIFGTLSYPQSSLLVLLLPQFKKLISDFCCPFNRSPNVLLSLISYILPLSSCLLPILQLTLPLAYICPTYSSLSLILSTLSPLISYSQLVQQTTFRRASHLQTTVRLIIKYLFLYI